MKSRAFITALILVAISLMIAYTRSKYLGTSLFPGNLNSVWQVQSKISYSGKKGDATISYAVPSRFLNAKIEEESYSSSELGVASIFKGYKRLLVWAGKLKSNKDLEFYYTVNLRRGTSGINVPADLAELPSLFDESESGSVNKLIEIAKKTAKSPEGIANYLAGCLEGADCENGKFLGRFLTSEQRKTRVLANLLNDAGYRSVVARGFIPNQSGEKTKFKYWVRYKIPGSKWRDIVVGNLDTPSSQLIFWDYLNTSSDIVKGSDDNARVSIALKPIDGSSTRTNVKPGEYSSTLWRILSLRSVPVSVQVNYEMILLIPLGALVVTLLRNIVGLPTFGTFLPVLVAIAFREMGYALGVMLLSMVVIFGLGVRSLLSSLQLLMVPRLSATLSIVILLILVLSRVSFELGYSAGLSVTLFPIVIITMLIERISISLDEQGFRKTMSLFVYSMLSAFASYSIMTSSILQHVLFSFPEFVLIVLAMTILCGRYTGYRLLEFYRFRAFAK